MHSIYDAKLKLSGEQIKPYLSGYFVEGFRQEGVAVEEVDIDGSRIRGRCRIVNPFLSPYDGLFHLSILNATHVLVSLGLTHSFVLQKYKEKNVEALLTDFEISCSRAIREETIPVEMNVFSRRVTVGGPNRTHSRTFYSWRYTLGNGGVWFGTLGAAFPFGDPE